MTDHHSPADITATEHDFKQASPKPELLNAAQKRRDPVQKILQYEPKVHYRVVFEELGRTIDDLGSLSGSLQALADALEGKVFHHGDSRNTTSSPIFKA